MKRLTFALVFAALAFTAPAHAETVNCTAITTLPYTITTQGAYCLTGHLSTGITSGQAITINTNNVVLDLNGFKLGGLSAGLGTTATGIYANQRQNITIKNGTVRGFYRGIFLEDGSPYTTSQGHVIEDIRADQNIFHAISIAGKGNVIRNNQVVATGGVIGVGSSGISVYGPGARVLNNDVTEVAAISTGFGASGIDLFSSSNSVVAGNRVGNVTDPSSESAFGIYAGPGSNDTLVYDNRLTGITNGIVFYYSVTGKYMNNMTQNVTTPYSGGTAAGTTNY